MENWINQTLNKGLLEDCCRKKGYFQCRNSAVQPLLRRNWFHVFSYERLFSFCYWGGIPSTLLLSQYQTSIWLIADHTFAKHMLTSLSVDEILLPRYMNLSTNFEKPATENRVVSLFKIHLLCFICIHAETNVPAACSRLCRLHLASVGVFARSTRSSAWSASVIVSAGYHLLLAFWGHKAIFFY